MRFTKFQLLRPHRGLRKPSFAAKSLSYPPEGAPPPPQTDLQNPSRSCLFMRFQLLGPHTAPTKAQFCKIIKNLSKTKLLRPNRCFTSPPKVRLASRAPPGPLQIMSFTKFQLAPGVSQGAYKSPVSKTKLRRKNRQTLRSKLKCPDLSERSV